MSAANDDDALAAAALRLQHRFTNVSATTVDETLNSAYESLLATSRITTYVMLLAERQAAEALARIEATFPGAH